MRVAATASRNRRVRLIRRLALALLRALAFGAGMTTGADAAAPQPGGNGPVPTTTGPTFPTADATVVRGEWVRPNTTR